MVGAEAKSAIARVGSALARMPPADLRRLLDLYGRDAGAPGAALVEFGRPAAEADALLALLESISVARARAGRG